jgi:two-component sensor histidine kinase
MTLSARWRSALTGVRGRLLALMMVAAVPLAGITLGNAYRDHAQAVAGLGQRAASLQEMFAVQARAALDAQEALLRGLAASDWLARAVADCHAALAALSASQGERYTSIWVLDAEGVERCSSLGQMTGRSFADQGYFQTLRAGRPFARGGFAVGPVTSEAVLQAAAPILRDGALAGVVGGALRLEGLRQSIGADAAAQLWAFDGQGGRLALGGTSDAALPPPEALAPLLAAVRPALLRGGDGVLRAWAASPPGDGMRWLLGLPAERALAEANRRFNWRLAEIGLFLGACVFVILAGTEVACARPMRLLAKAVTEWRPGRPFRPIESEWDPWEVRALNQAIEDAAATIETREQELSLAIRQRDAMLAEVHHRVKNNLQIVASLLNLQAGRIADPTIRAEFLLARERVQALATLHRHLYVQGDFAAVAIAPLLREMGAQIVAASANAEAVRLEIEAAALMLRTEHAVSVTLFVAEALTNALRHAFPLGRTGRISVRLEVAGDEALLEVTDDGVGMAADPRSAEGVGLSLMRGFAAHLEGELEVETEAGTVVRLTFPLPDAASPPAPASVR